MMLFKIKLPQGRRFAMAITAENVLESVDNRTLLQTTTLLYEQIKCNENPALYVSLLDRHLLWAMDRRLTGRLDVETDLELFVGCGGGMTGW